MLLFSLRRNVGKDASGKPVIEMLDGELCWQPKDVPDVKSPTAVSSGPVIERALTNVVVNCSFEQPPIMAYADGQLWANVPAEEMKPWQTSNT